MTSPSLSAAERITARIVVDQAQRAVIEGLRRIASEMQDRYDAEILLNRADAIEARMREVGR